MKNKSVRLLCLIMMMSLSFVIMNCSGEKKKEEEKKKNYEIETNDSLTVVKNKNIPNNPDFNLTLTQVDSIPFADKEESKERSFKMPTAMCSDDDGNIYIADFTTSKIYKFTKDFKFLFSFGGKGTGPGEFFGGPVTISYANDKISAS